MKPNNIIIFAPLNNKVKNYYMDANGIISLISNVGFPVAVCVALFYNMEKQNERHQSETDKLNETVQSNTKVLTELCTLIKTLVK
ncbi:MAG: YvrJ protein family protein [Bacteriophage sp.]|nr:MAG: YvrJ protein family protein [Bacteriophage sp.]